MKEKQRIQEVQRFFFKLKNILGQRRQWRKVHSGPGCHFNSIKSVCSYNFPYQICFSYTAHSKTPPSPVIKYPLCYNSIFSFFLSLDPAFFVRKLPTALSAPQGIHTPPTSFEISSKILMLLNYSVYVTLQFRLVFPLPLILSEESSQTPDLSSSIPSRFSIRRTKKKSSRTECEENKEYSSLQLPLVHVLPL